MNMMSKLSLVVLAMCAATSVAHAEDKSYGTATAKVTLNAAQEWAIEKVSDGEINLNKDNKLDKTVSRMSFKVTNNTVFSWE